MSAQGLLTGFDLRPDAPTAPARRLEIPLQEAFEHAMHKINPGDLGVALFVHEGRVVTVRRRSSSYERKMRRFIGGLVGVYDAGVDAKVVLEDLREFCG